MSNIITQIYGVPRSGGSLVWNILRSMVKVLSPQLPDEWVWQGNDGRRIAYIAQQNILHNKDIIIIALRDFRDCILSAWRIDPCKAKTPGFETTTEENLVSLDDERILDLLKYHQRFYYALDLYKSRWINDRIIILRYENFYNNYDVIFDKILEGVNRVNALQLTLEESDRENIKNEWSIESVKKIQHQYENFGQWDRSTNIHGLHIGTAEVGTWTQFLNNIIDKLESNE